MTDAPEFPRLTAAEAFTIASDMEAALDDIAGDVAVLLELANGLAKSNEHLSKALARLGYDIEHLAGRLEYERQRLVHGLHHHAFPDVEEKAA